MITHLVLQIRINHTLGQSVVHRKTWMKSQVLLQTCLTHFIHVLSTMSSLRARTCLRNSPGVRKLYWGSVPCRRNPTPSRCMRSWEDWRSSCRCRPWSLMRTWFWTSRSKNGRSWTSWSASSRRGFPWTRPLNTPNWGSPLWSTTWNLSTHFWTGSLTHTVYMENSLPFYFCPFCSHCQLRI